MKPLPNLAIRNFNLELEERLRNLKTMETLVTVKASRGRKIYGLGSNIGPGDLILRNFLRILQPLFKPYGDAKANFTLTDTGNAARTIFVLDVANYSICGAYASTGVKLGIGNPASAITPARTDYELDTLVAMFNPSATTGDETNWRVTVTGSYVWVAGGTVRETGQYIVIRDSGGSYRTFLIYHDSVSAVTVPAGGTASVTYTTQL